MKTAKTSNLTQKLLISTSVAAILISSNAMATGPTDGVCVIGACSVTQPDVNTTNMNQDSLKAIYSFGTFDTDAAHTVNVNMTQGAPSIALARINDNKPTQFDGKLRTPNGGQVWLINSNGFIFGSTANVDVGSLLVSTANITNDNFLNPGNAAAVSTKQYKFDQAGNATAAIVLREGAQIKVKQAQQEIVRLLTELGGELSSTANSVNSDFGEVITPNGTVFNAIDLKNWTLKSGTSIDSIASGDQGLFYGTPTRVMDVDVLGSSLSQSSANQPEGAQERWFDMGGTGNASKTDGFAVLESKELFDLPEGNFSLTYLASGSNRGAAGGIAIDFLDEAGNIIAPSSNYPDNLTGAQGTAGGLDVLPGDGFLRGYAQLALTQPGKVRIRISVKDWGNAPGTPTNVYAGPSLGDVKFSYNSSNPYTGGGGSEYVSLNAPGILFEDNSPVIEEKRYLRDATTGAGIFAPGGKIHLTAGQTFTADSTYDQQIVNVTPEEAVTTPAIVDGVPMKHAIDLQPGSFLWAAAPYRAYANTGEVSLNAKVTQGVFDGFDANSNGNTDRRFTHNDKTFNETSDIISVGKGDARDGIQEGQDFHEATGITPGWTKLRTGEVLKGNFNFIETIVPNPTAPVVNIDEQIVTQQFDANGRPIISFQDKSIDPQYVNYDTTVVGGNNLFGGATPVSTGGDLGALAPAAGGNNASPAAGGDESTACANEQLQNPLKVNDQDSRCNVAQETNQAI